MLAAATAAHQASLQVAAAPDTSAIGPLTAEPTREAGSSCEDNAPCRSAGASARVSENDGVGGLHEVASTTSLVGAHPPHAAEPAQPSIVRQTAAALGLWEQLHETASTPSTVLSSQAARLRAAAAVSTSTDQSAA